MDISLDSIIIKLKNKARPDQLEGMSRFGITIRQRLGVSIPELRKMAKAIKRNHRLALELYKTKIAEAKILASMIAEPNQLTETQMEKWVKEFDSWDVCDQVCMNLFDKTPLAWKKIKEWSQRKEEFVKRAAYALIACLAWHNKEANDNQFIKLFPIIKNGSNDERNYVKKAVNWALRHIGKRNLNLNKEAITLAQEIKKFDSKAARWIASNAIRELESEAIQKRLKNK